MIKDFFVENNLEFKNKTFLLAASGGPDSMALLQMLNNELDKTSQLVVAHLDHQIRNDSYLEYELLKKVCKQNGLLLFNKSWPNSLHPQTGVEAAARNYRYHFLAEVAKKINADYLLTAHHGDDLLENILLKLIRSGDASEMSSLQPVRSWQGIFLIRPLLKYSKQQLLDFDRANNISFIEDATNAADDVQRNRLRHHVVPLLKKENPNILANGLRFIDSVKILQDERQQYFSKIKAEAFMGCLRLKEEVLLKMNSKLRADYFSYLIQKKWHRQVKFSDMFLKKQDSVQRDGFKIVYYQGYYYLYRVKDFLKKNFELQKIVLNMPFVWQNSKYLITDKRLVDKEKLQIGSFYMPKFNKMTAGGLLAGTKLQLANGQWSKPKKKFAENAIPLFLRAHCLTIYVDDQVVFVENTYQNQRYSENYLKYNVYQIKN